MGKLSEGLCFSQMKVKVKPTTVKPDLIFMELEWNQGDSKSRYQVVETRLFLSMMVELSLGNVLVFRRLHLKLFEALWEEKSGIERWLYIIGVDWSEI